MPTTSIYLHEKTTHWKEDYYTYKPDYYFCVGTKRIDPTSTKLLKSNYDSDDPYYMCSFTMMTYWKIEYTYELNSEGYAVLYLDKQYTHKNAYGELINPDPVNVLKIILKGEPKIEIDINKCKNGVAGIDPKTKMTSNASKRFGTGDHVKTITAEIHPSALKGKIAFNDQKEHEITLILKCRDKHDNYLGKNHETELKMSTRTILSGITPVDVNFTVNLQFPSVEVTRGIFNKRTETIKKDIYVDVTLLVDLVEIKTEYKILTTYSKNIIKFK